MGWFIVDFLHTYIQTSKLEKQKEYSIDERFILLEASNKEELNEKIAEEIKTINEMNFYFYKSSTRLGINNKSINDKEKYFSGDGDAIGKFLGIRKIYPLSNDISRIYNRFEPPKDNDFIMRSSYKLDSFEDINKFLQGEVIDFLYLVDDQINLAQDGELK